MLTVSPKATTGYRPVLPLLTGAEPNTITLQLSATVLDRQQNQTSTVTAHVTNLYGNPVPGRWWTGSPLRHFSRTILRLSLQPTRPDRLPAVDGTTQALSPGPGNVECDDGTYFAAAASH